MCLFCSSLPDFCLFLLALSYLLCAHFPFQVPSPFWPLLLLSCYIFFLLCTHSWLYLSLLILLFIVSPPPTFFSSYFSPGLSFLLLPKVPFAVTPFPLSPLFPVSAACSEPPVLPVASLALSLATESLVPCFSCSLAPLLSYAFFIFHLLFLGPFPRFFSFPFLTVFSSFSSSSYPFPFSHSVSPPH